MKVGTDFKTKKSSQYSETSSIYQFVLAINFQIYPFWNLLYWRFNISKQAILSSANFAIEFWNIKLLNRVFNLKIQFQLRKKHFRFLYSLIFIGILLSAIYLFLPSSATKQRMTDSLWSNPGEKFSSSEDSEVPNLVDIVTILSYL